ncbi:MAG: ATP synthase F1 subunit gamma [Halobacteriovoraceae bacterium]|jgi:F-type H+-transporting ATPase subunit gamma|nr:ATP synthase F1 subunit gamma [Halobacteriovoraceae bacterium]MBT5096122.1 ATP synthase F1 subunit gamma [Halobacteriovoraceae bacterium]
MANIKDLKKQIKSTKGTLKITSAMKLVSAAKLSKAQQAITGARPYADELEETIKTVGALVQNYEHSYLKTNDENKQTILLVISANKGLCGGYNSVLAKEVRRFLVETELDVKVSFIGKKVKEIIGTEVNMGEFYTFEKTDPNFAELQEVGNKLATLFTTGEIGRILIAYNSFNSAISFDSTVKQVLPLSLDENAKAKVTEQFPFDFKYDPNAEEILDTLIPETYVSTLWTCLLNAVAAEHGSRMSSMDNAVSNCKEAIKTQTLKMNKLRQAAITTELIEVVSGAESLKG